MDLRVGDIVQLKSCGLSMTIDEVIRNEVECIARERQSEQTLGILLKSIP
jgi:uncharacterized protein YodC (DUF2158 family)